MHSLIIEKDIVTITFYTCLLFLFFINFHSLIIGVIIFMIAIYNEIKEWQKEDKIKLDINSLLLLGFALSYTTIAKMYDLITTFEIMRFLILPMGLYLLGRSISCGGRFDEKIPYFLSVMIISLFVFGSYWVFKTLYYGEGIVQLYIREGKRIVFGPGEEGVLNATNIGAYFYPAISLFGYIYIKDNGKRHIRFLRWLYILILVLTCIALMYIGNRLGIFIAISCFVLELGVYLIYENNMKRKIKSMIFVVIIIAVIFLMVHNNYFDITNIIRESTIAERILKTDPFHDIRFIAWKNAFLGIFEYPTGGKKANLPINYAHNLWLDVGYTGGLMPFILLLLFSISVLKDYLRIVANVHIRLGLKVLITGVYCAFIINFMFEPILEGSFIIFCAFCFFSGLTRFSGKILNEKI